MYKVLEGQWNINEIIQNNKYVILQFGSNSCNPCHAISYRLQQWERENPNVIVLYIPTEKYIKESSQLEVFTVPTILTYIDNKLDQKISGYFSLDKLLDRMSYLMKL